MPPRNRLGDRPGHRDGSLDAVGPRQDRGDRECRRCRWRRAAARSRRAAAARRRPGSRRRRCGRPAPPATDRCGIAPIAAARPGRARPAATGRARCRLVRTTAARRRTVVASPSGASARYWSSDATSSGSARLGAGAEARVERHAERGLVGGAGAQRRPVGGREDGERAGRDQERDGGERPGGPAQRVGDADAGQRPTGTARSAPGPPARARRAASPRVRRRRPPAPAAARAADRPGRRGAPRWRCRATRPGCATAASTTAATSLARMPCGAGPRRCAGRLPAGARAPRRARAGGTSAPPPARRAPAGRRRRPRARRRRGDPRSPPARPGRCRPAPATPPRPP